MMRWDLRYLGGLEELRRVSRSGSWRDRKTSVQTIHSPNQFARYKTSVDGFRVVRGPVRQNT